LKSLPCPYDESADADAGVAAASASAKARHKLSLINLGGNWCTDSGILPATMELAPVKAFVQAHYGIVKVDVDRFDKNLQIPARYGIAQRLEGAHPLRASEEG
jgi:hypothetical protein